MSKSLNNAISLIETEDEIEKKILKTKTDTNRIHLKDPGNPENCPVIYPYHKIFGEKEGIPSIIELENQCKEGKMGCVECKNYLSIKINQELSKIREKYHQLTENEVKRNRRRYMTGKKPSLVLFLCLSVCLSVCLSAW